MDKITIFTPTYNRGYILPELYYSLEQQTCKDFIWLVVDDGSTDNTYDLVQAWVKKGEIKIEYHKQNNQGKSMAHNKGVELTKSELFTCVDSDDYLLNNAVEEILFEWNKRSELSMTVGILTYKGLPNGKSLTSMKDTLIKSTTLKNAYSKLDLKGDTMLIFKTEIISKFKFPKFKNEKFVPEAYLYDLVDQEGELLILRKILYFCEYLDDGYTKNMSKLLANNPKGYLEYIKQRLAFDRELKDKMLDTIRYTAMCISSKKKKKIRDSVYPIITILTFPLGYYFYLKRYR